MKMKEIIDLKGSHWIVSIICQLLWLFVWSDKTKYEQLLWKQHCNRIKQLTTSYKRSDGNQHGCNA